MLLEKTLSDKQILNRIYKDLCAFEISKQEERAIRESKGSPVYGEINFTAAKKLFDCLNLSKDDVFYDLGSGAGKIIMQALIQTNIKKAVGIELSNERHNIAVKALENATEFFPNIKKRAQFINKDLMSANLTNATVIYTCSTAFSLLFMKKIVTKLAQIKRPFLLASLQDLPDNNYFELVETLKLDMSWIKKTPVHIYKRVI